MEEDLISVIIPVFNIERYLAACLDSVISQSYRNIEIIVVNDGSTDFSLNIAQKYAEQDDRITVYHQDNEGLSSARNRGLSVATGQLVTFVDSDDLLLPDALQVLYGLLTQRNADIVEGSFIIGSTHTEITPPAQINVTEYSAEQAIEDVLYQKTLIPAMPGKLFRRELFESSSFENGRIYEDLNLFYIIMAKAKKIVATNFPVYFYRQTEGSILHTWNQNRLDVLHVTEKIEEYIQEHYPSLLPAAKERRLSANFNMFALCSIHGDHETAKKCWQHIKENRRKSLLNPKTRMKNKAGILLSYLGKHTFKLIARNFYKRKS